jgi:hypothetical protein
MLEEQPQLPGTDKRRQQLVEHRKRDPRFVAEPGHAAIARVEPGRVTRRRGQGVMPQVVRTDAIAEFTVTARAAESLDPWVLVGRDGLRGDLPADPVGRLGADDPQPCPARGERCGAPAESSPDDDDVGRSFTVACGPLGGNA